MRSIHQMVATYQRKLTAFWAGAPNPPDIISMTAEYRTKIEDLREKQMLTKDILNEAGIPGGKQAHFQVLTNRFWYLQTMKDYGGATAIAEFGYAIILFTAKFLWAAPDIAIAKAVAFNVYGVEVV